MTTPTRKPRKPPGTRKSSDNARWPDRTRTERSARRVEALNAKAKEWGFDSWRKFETALLRGEFGVMLVKRTGNKEL